METKDLNLRELLSFNKVVSWFGREYPIRFSPPQLGVFQVGMNCDTCSNVQKIWSYPHLTFEQITPPREVPFPAIIKEIPHVFHNMKSLGRNLVKLWKLLFKGSPFVNPRIFPFFLLFLLPLFLSSFNSLVRLPSHHSAFRSPLSLSLSDTQYISSKSSLSCPFLLFFFLHHTHTQFFLSLLLMS